jgi:xanthine/CO dehydrogenase XdhC/CoxF family maturation factor
MSVQPGPSARQQSWSDARVDGRVIVLTRNPITDAVETIARTVGREVVVVTDDEDGRGVHAVRGLGLREGDAVLLCDHDAPDAPAVLRDALASPASYVAMMASRSRAQAVVAELEAEGAPGLDKLRVPAGLDIGGKAPGEIALSVVAEIVATAYGRPGTPMRDR